MLHGLMAVTLSLLHIPVDEQWVLWACKNCNPERDNFNFEQVPFDCCILCLVINVPKHIDVRTDR